MNEIEFYKNELEIQKRIAYVAGILHGDITIKTLLESLSEGVVIVNELGRIILINDKLKEMTGFNKKDVMGQSLNIFLEKQIHDKHNDHIVKYFSNPRKRPMGLGMELSANRKDNTTFPVEISLSTLKTEGGILGIAFVTDITIRKNEENKLKILNKNLDAYAHTVAHDLKSSVNSIVGFSEILIEKYNSLLEEKRNKYLFEMARNGKKMSNIINELLLFSSTSVENIPFSLVDMKAIINNALDRLKFEIKTSTANIIIQENIHNCIGYGAWIEEIWFNYLSNAIKYGGKPPEIKIGSEIVSDTVVKYFVVDNGAGIPLELKELIFDDKNYMRDFHTKGSGLGLSIVRRIAEKLNGTVSFEQVDGNGTSFNFFMLQQ